MPGSRERNQARMGMGWGRAALAGVLLFLTFVVTLALVPSKLYRLLASGGVSTNLSHLAVSAWELAWVVLLAACVPLLQKRGWL